MQISLGGKRAFITAGGAGMGRATALAVHAVGAEVFTCVRSKPVQRLYGEPHCEGIMSAEG